MTTHETATAHGVDYDRAFPMPVASNPVRYTSFQIMTNTSKFGLVRVEVFPQYCNSTDYFDSKKWLINLLTYSITITIRTPQIRHKNDGR